VPEEPIGAARLGGGQPVVVVLHHVPGSLEDLPELLVGVLEHELDGPAGVLGVAPHFQVLRRHVLVAL